MKDLEISPKVSLDKVDALYNEYFHKITRLQDRDIIVRANCKFCTHPARAEAEEVWERTGSFAPVDRFFKKYREEHPEIPPMYYANIKTHVLSHYQEQQKKIWLREYADRIKSVMNRRISDEERLVLLSYQMEMQMNEIVSDPQLDVLKKADAMTKLGKMLLDIMLVRGKLKGEIQTATVVKEKFENTWCKIINAANSEEERRKLVSALEMFQDELEGIPVDSVRE